MARICSARSPTLSEINLPPASTTTPSTSKVRGHCEPRFRKESFIGLASPDAVKLKVTVTFSVPETSR